MPFETASFPFEPGDDDMADFMLDRWLVFAVSQCNWVANRAVAPFNPGTRPEIEIWTHRGTVGTPAAPYFFCHTKADSLAMYAGDDVDLTDEIYDQPNNPANAPQQTNFNIPTGGSVTNSARHNFINSAAGPYSGYWLFADTTGEYVHCVLKVNSRQYRHFHIGKLRQVDGGVDLDTESYYQTGHFWSSLDPNPINYPISAGANEEHNVYANAHRLPFRNQIGTNPNGAFGSAMPMTVPPALFYIPNLYPLQVLSATVNVGGTGHAVDDIITLDLTDGVYAGTGTPGQLRVTGETGGVIDTVSVEVVGNYGRLTGDQRLTPVIPQNGTTGTGIDAEFNVFFEGYKYFIPCSQSELQVTSSPAQKNGDGGASSGVGDVMVRSRIGAAQTNFYDDGLGTILFAADRNFTANANVLVPIYVAVQFAFQSDTRLGVVAQVPDVFRVNMRDYAPEQEITVGAETYVVFPMMNKDSQNTLTGEGYSGYEGLAYRKETDPVV